MSHNCIQLCYLTCGPVFGVQYTDVESLRAYLELSLEESDRVVKSIARAQRVYRFDASTQTSFGFDFLLHEAVALTHKYLSQRKVTLNTQFMAEPPTVTAVFSDLSLAYLCPILQLTDGIGRNGGGTLTLHLTVLAPYIQVKLTTSSISLPPGGFDVMLCDHVITNHSGIVAQYEEGQQATIDIKLPLSSVEAKWLQGNEYTSTPDRR